MSAVWHSYAVIGILIDKDKLYKEAKTVKAFAHNHPRTMKFCPDTGKELWKEVREPIPEWDESETLGSFKVHTSTDSHDHVVGIIAADEAEMRGSGVDFTKLPDNLADEKYKLKELLEPLGLWDESKFGLYSILYCSY
tara:strand:- start:2476 stop:2889 length:414 start_codon:yes stop_codon:yes gene_type:complete